MALELHTPITHIKPEAYMSGSVIIRVPPGTWLHITTIVVQIIGTIKVQATSNNESNSMIDGNITTFLNLKHGYEKGPRDIGSDFTCRFGFMLPQDPASVDHDPTDPRGRVLPQILPPSGDFGSGNLISYTLTASVIETNTRKELTASTTLQFSQTRAIEIPEPQSVIIAHERLLPLQDPQAPQLKYKFAVALLGPQVIIQEQAFSLALRLWSKLWASCDGPAPKVILKSCTVDLLIKTSIKIGETAKQRTTEKLALVSFNSSSEADPTGVELSIHESHLGTLPGASLSVPCKYVPTFRYANIKRAYELFLSVTVECQGITFNLPYEVNPITVLAAESAASRRAKERAEAMEYYASERYSKSRIIE